MILLSYRFRCFVFFFQLGVSLNARENGWFLVEKVPASAKQEEELQCSVIFTNNEVDNTLNANLWDLFT